MIEGEVGLVFRLGVFRDTPLIVVIFSGVFSDAHWVIIPGRLQKHPLDILWRLLSDSQTLNV